MEQKLKLQTTSDLAKDSLDPTKLILYHKDEKLKGVAITCLTKDGDQVQKRLGDKKNFCYCLEEKLDFQPKQPKYIRQVHTQTVNRLVSQIQIVIEDKVTNQDQKVEIGSLQQPNLEAEGESISSETVYNDQKQTNFAITLQFQEKLLVKFEIKFLPSNDVEHKVALNNISMINVVSKIPMNSLKVEMYISLFPKEWQNMKKENMEYFDNVLKIYFDLETIRINVNKHILSMQRQTNLFKGLLDHILDNYNQTFKKSQGNFQITQLLEFCNLSKGLEERLEALDELQTNGNTLLNSIQNIETKDIDKLKQRFTNGQAQDHISQELASKYAQINKIYDDEIKLKFQKKEQEIQIERLEALIQGTEKQISLSQSKITQYNQTETDLNETMNQKTSSLQDYYFKKIGQTSQEYDQRLKMNQDLCKKNQEQLKKQLEINSQPYLAKKKEVNNSFTISGTSPAKFDKISFIQIVDVSDSMKPHMNTLNLAQQQIKDFYNSFSNDHQFSLVLFGSEAKIIYKKHKASDMQSIPNITMGATNFREAFEEGCRILDQTDDGYTPIMIFFTDGQDTSSSQSSLPQVLANRKKLYSDMILFTIAFGTGNIDRGYLQTLRKSVNQDEIFKVGGQKLAFYQSAESLKDLISVFQTINDFFKMNNQKHMLNQIEAMLEAERVLTSKLAEQIRQDSIREQDEILQEKEIFLRQANSQQKDQDEQCGKFLNQRLQEVQNLREIEIDKLKQLKNEVENYKIEINKIQETQREGQEHHVGCQVKGKDQLQQEASQIEEKQSQEIQKQMEMSGFTTIAQFQSFQQYSTSLKDYCIAYSETISTLQNTVEMQNQGIKLIIRELKQISSAPLTDLVTDSGLRSKLVSTYPDLKQESLNKTLSEQIENLLEKSYSFRPVKAIYQLVSKSLNFTQIALLEEKGKESYIQKTLVKKVQPFRDLDRDQSKNSDLSSSDEEENKKNQEIGNQAKFGSKNKKGEDEDEDNDFLITDLDLEQLRTESKVEQRLEELERAKKKLKIRYKELKEETNKSEKKKKKQKIKDKKKEFELQISVLQTLLNQDLLRNSLLMIVESIQEVLSEPVLEILRENICKRFETQLTSIQKLTSYSRYLGPLKEIVGNTDQGVQLQQYERLKKMMMTDSQDTACLNDLKAIQAQEKQ